MLRFSATEPEFSRKNSGYLRVSLVPQARILNESGLALSF